MDNLWYLLVGFLLGSSHDSKSSKSKVDYSPETIRIVMMISIPIVIILAIIMLRTLLSYHQ